RWDVPCLPPCRRRDVCASELLCASLASYGALYSMPMRETPDTSYHGNCIKNMGMDGGRRRGKKSTFRHTSSEFRQVFCPSRAYILQLSRCHLGAGDCRGGSGSNK